MTAFSLASALTTRAPPFRLAGNECIDPQVRAETNDAGGVSRGRTRQTEPQTRKRTRYRKPHSSVSPYTCETEIPFGRQMSGGSENNAECGGRDFGRFWRVCRATLNGHRTPPKPVRASISVARWHSRVPHNPVRGCITGIPMCLQTVEYESPTGIWEPHGHPFHRHASPDGDDDVAGPRSKDAVRTREDLVHVRISHELRANFTRIFL